jgi:hypothetical protein
MPLPGESEPVTVLAPDPFAQALWALKDAEAEAKRTRPIDPSAPITPGQATGDTVQIGDPAKYAQGALERALEEFLNTPSGGRNHALNTAAFSLGRLVAAGLLPEQTVRDQLLNAAAQIGLLNEDGTYTCNATISSGLGAGAKDPLCWVLAPPNTAPTAAPFVIPAAPNTEQPTPGPPPAAPDPDTLHHLRVAGELATLRARDEAKDLLNSEKALRDFRIPPSRLSVREELELPDDPVTYAIDHVLPTGTNALLTAGYKTGKTTTVGDLAVAHADGTQFLGKFNVTPCPGRLAIFNYELSDSMYRRWLRELNIEHPERLAVLHLRGFRLPVIVKHVEDWTVRWLIEHEVTRWVVDPFARAYTGCGSENDNGEVGRFLDTLDVIKERAGVTELILPTHTGRMDHEIGEERARGATRLDDWADVRWMLTADDDGNRYFSATGRDVDEPEELLKYDETTRRYIKEGGDRKHVSRSSAESKVLAAISSKPGLNLTELRETVGGKTRSVDNAIKSLTAGHRIHLKKVGNTNTYWLGSGLSARPFQTPHDD